MKEVYGRLSSETTGENVDGSPNNILILMYMSGVQELSKSSSKTLKVLPYWAVPGRVACRIWNPESNSRQNLFVVEVVGETCGRTSGRNQVVLPEEDNVEFPSVIIG